MGEEQSMGLEQALPEEQALGGYSQVRPAAEPGRAAAEQEAERAATNQAEAQRLRGALFRVARDEARGATLAGLELPDLDFGKAPTRAAALAFLDGQIAGLRNVFIDFWDYQHREP